LPEIRSGREIDPKTEAIANVGFVFTTNVT
jgi:hypothetical protein